MMAQSYFYLTAILGSLLIQNAGCSVVFTAQPNFVMYGFPQPLSLGCHLDDSDTVGTVPEVNSIFITRGQTKQRQNETVAFITPFESAMAKVDLGVIQVTGEFNSNHTGDQAYLNVEWKSPGEKQAAVYECKIKTTLGTKKAIQSISYVVPDNKQLLDKVSALEKESFNKIEMMEKYVKTDLLERMYASEKTTLQKIDSVEKTTLQKIDSVDKNAKKELLDKISASEKAALQKIDTVEKTTLQKIDSVDKNVKKDIVDKISASEKATLQKIDSVDKNVKKDIIDKISASEKITLQKIDSVDKNAKKELVDKISASDKATLQKIETINNNVNLRVPVIESTLKAVQERHMEIGEVTCLLKDFVKVAGNLQVATTVRFKVPYRKVPMVFCSFMALDLKSDQHVSLLCKANQITERSFSLVVEKWKTEVDAVRVSWFSYDF